MPRISRVRRMATMAVGLSALWGAGALAEELRQERTFDYDSRGRVSRSVEMSYDESGARVSITHTRFEFDPASGKPVLEEQRTEDTRGQVLGTLTNAMLYTPHGVLLSEERTWRDGLGETTKREVATWRTDSADAARIRDTAVYDADGELLENRYSIEARDAAGRVLSTDESRYDASGVQQGRLFVQLSYDTRGQVAGRAVFHFDAEDDVTQRVEEEWRYNAQGQLQAVEALTYDGRDVLVQRAVDQRFYHAMTGRMERRRYTFYGHDGAFLRALEEGLRYDDRGRLQSRTGNWTYAEQ